MKKSTVLSALKRLPNEFHLDDFLERLLVIQKIDEGLKDSREGRTIPLEKAKKLIAKWQE